MQSRWVTGGCNVQDHSGALAWLQEGREDIALLEELAERCEAEVVLLTVSGPPGGHVDVYQQEVEQAHNEAEAYLRAVHAEFREKGVKARSRVVHGPVVKSILNAAEEAGRALFQS